MKLTIDVSKDSYPDSPRKWDNIGTMVCWHSRYNLGDEQPKCSENEWLRFVAAEQVHADPDSLSDDDVEKIVDKYLIVIPLYIYNHGGITMRTRPFSCPWDSGKVGYIYATRESIIDQYGDDSKESRNKARACLEAEVAVYNQYIQGDVWGFTIKDGDEIVESFGGFYDKSNAAQEAANLVKTIIFSE